MQDASTSSPHEQTHTGASQPSIAPRRVRRGRGKRKTLEGEANRVRCEIPGCASTFSRSDSLRTHLRDVHEYSFQYNSRGLDFDEHSKKYRDRSPSARSRERRKRLPLTAISNFKVYPGDDSGSSQPPPLASSRSASYDSYMNLGNTLSGVLSTSYGLADEEVSADGELFVQSPTAYMEPSSIPLHPSNARVSADGELFVQSPTAYMEPSSIPLHPSNASYPTYAYNEQLSESVAQLTPARTIMDPSISLCSPVPHSMDSSTAASWAAGPASSITAAITQPLSSSGRSSTPRPFTPVVVRHSGRYPVLDGQSELPHCLAESTVHAHYDTTLSPTFSELPTPTGDICKHYSCPRRAQPLQWRFHCVTCAEEGINHNLCWDCYWRSPRSPVVAASSSSLPATGHLDTHVFTFFYNVLVPRILSASKNPANQHSGTSHATIPYLPDLRDFRWTGDRQQPSQLAREVVRELYLMGAKINDLAECHDVLVWSKMQDAQSADCVDLSLFYHQGGEHEYLLLLFWSLSSILKNQAAVGLQFLHVSRIADLGTRGETREAERSLLYDLRESLARQNISIDVSRFDFGYIKEVIIALSCLCTFFDKPEFTAVYNAITADRDVHRRQFTQLNDYVMTLIDQQPTRLDEILLDAFSSKRAINDDAYNGKTLVSVTRYLQDLIKIAGEFQRACVLRQCRLRMTQLMFSVMDEINPISEDCQWNDKVEFISFFNSLSPYMQRLLQFLRYAHEDFRPLLGSSLYASGERYLRHHIASGESLSRRLKWLMKGIVRETDLVNAPISEGPMPPRYTDGFYINLRDLFELFVFVAREFDEPVVEAALAGMQHCAQIRILQSTLTTRERWKPSGRHPGEVVAILRRRPASGSTTRPRGRFFRFLDDLRSPQLNRYDAELALTHWDEEEIVRRDRHSTKQITPED